jgi:NSS family neurotransmitter:Na+ symporter
MQFYLAPHLSSLVDPLVWISAFGQGFFSIGVGMGVMITYGSYLGSEENIASSSVLITVADVLAAFLAGLVMFPIVFSFGGEPAAGPQLAFDTLPRVFRQFPGITAYAIATSFYLSLTIAALASAVSLLETVLVALMEATGVGRRGSLALLLGILILLGLPSALSYSAVELTLFGYPVLDHLDKLTGMLFLPLGVLTTAIILGWLTPMHRIVLEVKPGFVGWSCLLLVRFAVPAAVVAVLITTITQRLGSQ